MEPRHYLALVFEDATNDKTIPFGEDRGSAAKSLQDMVQCGGPTGIVSAILFSTKKLIKTTKLYPKAWHESQRNASIESSDALRESGKTAVRLRLERRFSDLQAEAEENGILLPMANLVISSEDLDDDSPLTPVDISELMHGAQPPATPWQDLSVDERRQRVLAEAASLGLALAPEIPAASPTGSQDAAAPAAPSDGGVALQATPDAATATAAAAQTIKPGGQKAKGVTGGAKTTQEPSRASEGAADSDSASNGPATSGDLLAGT